MVQTKMGRYCEQKKRWFIPEVWKKWWKKRKKKYPKCVPTCKSKSDDKRAKGGCRKTKKSAVAKGVGGKPSKVKTFAKKKKKKWVDQLVKIQW